MVGTCVLLFFGSLLAIAILIARTRSKDPLNDDERLAPVYDSISPAYEYINPMMVHTMTDNEAYTTSGLKCHA